MIRDLKKYEGGAKPFYTFNLVLAAWDMPVVSVGWKYFPASGVVRPPSFKNPAGFWIPSFSGVTILVTERIAEAIRRVLGQGNVSFGVVGQQPSEEAQEWLKTKQLAVEEQAAEALRSGQEKEYLAAKWGNLEAAKWVLEEMKRKGDGVRLQQQGQGGKDERR